MCQICPSICCPSVHRIEHRAWRGALRDAQSLTIIDAIDVYVIVADVLMQGSHESVIRGVLGSDSVCYQGMWEALEEGGVKFFPSWKARGRKGL